MAIGARTVSIILNAAVICGLSSATTAHAQLHAGDLVLRSEQGQVAVGGAAGGSQPTFPQRFFAGAFGDLGLPNRTADPGVNSIPGSFVTGAMVDMRLRRAARVWSATDRNFCQTPEAHVEVRKGTRVIVTPNADPVPPSLGPSITLGFSDSLDGLIHQHPAYWLTAPFDDGVYLIEVQIEAPPLLPSPPVWLLFSQNALPADMSDAIAFADETLANGSGNLCRCASDTNDDGAVDLIDLLSFLSAWLAELGTTGSGSGGTTLADFNRDGTSDLLDLLAFLDRWLPGC